MSIFRTPIICKDCKKPMQEAIYAKREVWRAEMTDDDNCVFMFWKDIPHPKCRPYFEQLLNKE